ncbi:MAG: hypothetical protein ABSB13_12310 [Candidatus Binatus sp.]|jgi:hypothetical protein|uniref:hypothetical protein n=1 Tax=Candidatus Binatus sp. TaxID=2811406 RepID=UPI003D12FE74
MGKTIDAFERAALHADRGCLLNAHIQREYIRILPIGNPWLAQGADNGLLARRPITIAHVIAET